MVILVHWPMPKTNKYVDTFKAFAYLRDQGRIRSIGVSNFEPEHLRTLIDATGVLIYFSIATAILAGV